MKTEEIEEPEAEPATAIELWNAGKPMEEIANVLERKAREYFTKQPKRENER